VHSGGEQGESGPALPDGAALPDEPAPTVTPAAAVTSYYAALDDRSFATAWKRLSPAVRRAFGGFTSWKAGFATTLASRPQDIVATALPGGAFAVRHVLVARDRSACGGDPVERRFSVRWRLVPAASGGWTAASLHAAALGAPAADPACH
jgi:hypothetical protein